jgi:hypothetical protein
MFRKAIVPVAAATLVSTAVFAANLPLITQWDPTNPTGSANALVQSINGGVTGVVASLPAAVATTAATIQTAYTVTLLAGSLTTGQTFHIKAIGVNDSNAQARTLTFSFGGSTCALTVTGTSAAWNADFWVTETGASTQTSTCVGQQGTTMLAPVTATNWTVSNSAAITVLVEQTAASAGIMTLNQSWAEVLR